MGNIYILDIDAPGFRAAHAEKFVVKYLFVASPSVEEPEKRLRGAGTEDKASILTRRKCTEVNYFSR